MTVASTQAANNWAVPCTSGSCEYNWVGDNNKTATSSMMLVRTLPMILSAVCLVTYRRARTKCCLVGTITALLISIDPVSSPQISHLLQAGKSWAAIPTGPKDRTTLPWSAREPPHRWLFVTIFMSMGAQKIPSFAFLRTCVLFFFSPLWNM